MTFTTFGAIFGLAVSIFLIIRKFHPVYSLVLGALIGGIIGGGGLAGTVDTMISGAQGMMSSVLRILTSGILAGALIKTGSAEKIAEMIVKKMGERFAILSIAISTMIICAVGVFVDISVITVAPIAMAIAKRAGYNKPSILLAMIGGGKAGNIISPNPNTIAPPCIFSPCAVATIMMKNILPAIGALLVTIVLATFLTKRSDDMISENDLEKSGHKKLPSFTTAIAGPLLVILLLALRPLFQIAIDPLIALPAGGILCMLATGQIKNIKSYVEFGLSKVIGVSILLIGTGTLAGIIKASNLQFDMISLLEAGNLPAFLLAPISGILMAGATASTTAGATIASQTFASTLISSGVDAVSAGAMVHSGATVIDSMPHGSFFHATGGSVNMQMKERMKLIPYEACVGITSTILSTILYLV